MPGTTIILSSHYLSELEHLCDRVAIIKDSKIIARGTPDEIKKKYDIKKSITIQTKPGKYKELATVLKKYKLNDINIANEALTIHTATPEKTITNIISAVRRRKEKLTFIKVTGASLDDVFLTIWKEKK